MFVKGKIVEGSNIGEIERVPIHQPDCGDESEIGKCGDFVGFLVVEEGSPLVLEGEFFEEGGLGGDLLFVLGIGLVRVF